MTTIHVANVRRARLPARATLALATAMVLAGCSSQSLQGIVAKEWSSEMRELQINPVFPPREDFKVGDIYLSQYPPDKFDTLIKQKGYMPISTWVGWADLNEELTDFYLSRVSFPISGADNVKIPGTNGVSPDALVEQAHLECNTAKDNCNIFNAEKRHDLSRLRLVAFPDFMKAKVTQADLSALIPIEAFSAALGISSATASSITLSVPIAEADGLPLLLAKTKLKAKAIEACNAITDMAFTVPGRKPRKGDGDFWMIAPTEVYYTRAIDISIDFSSEFGLGLDVSPTPTPTPKPTPAPGAGAGDGVGDGAGDGDAQTVAKLDPKPVPKDGKNATPETPPAGAGDDMSNRLDALNTRLTKLQGRTKVGGAISFMSISKAHVGMRRTFTRPVAIGYRGVWLNLKKSPKGCEITDSSPVGGTNGGAGPLLWNPFN